MQRGAEVAGALDGEDGAAASGVLAGAGAADGDGASVGAGVDGASAGILSGHGLRTGTTLGSTMIPRLISMRMDGETRPA
jgi:hypothetical protein